MTTETKGQKAFELRDARDLIQKLSWELTNLFCRERAVIAVCQYHAFNCAVTAWHISDWLWHDLSPATKDEIFNTTGVRLKTYDNFRDYIIRESHALRLCHQIANGSKHYLLKNTDSSVSAKISDGEGNAYGNPIITEGAIEHDAQRVFYEAMFWFQRFINEWNVFPEEPFVPRGDP